jgi:hypothetical protein
MSTEIETLRKQVEWLTAEVKRLDYSLNRCVDGLNGIDEIAHKHLKLHDRDIHEALERIINLELTVFPNLQNDIDHVYKVIGEGDHKADNPLDHRPPKKT